MLLLRLIREGCRFAYGMLMRMLSMAFFGSATLYEFSFYNPHALLSAEERNVPRSSRVDARLMIAKISLPPPSTALAFDLSNAHAHLAGHLRFASDSTNRLKQSP